MAKKKNYPVPVSSAVYTPPPISDNNPSSGLLDIPNYSTDPANEYDDKFCFHSLVGKGESPNSGDVNVITANGVQSSKGKDKGRQYNWGPGTDGTWNDNDFEGGNLTGM